MSAKIYCITIVMLIAYRSMLLLRLTSRSGQEYCVKSALAEVKNHSPDRLSLAEAGYRTAIGGTVAVPCTRHAADRGAAVPEHERRRHRRGHHYPACPVSSRADAVAAELLRRERAPHPLPRTTIELVGPEVLTGAAIATIWASVLGKDVRYNGDDLAAFESQAAGMMPGWMAHDFRLMLRAFHRFGLLPGRDSRAIVEALIGHSLRSYRAFAEEAAANW